MKSSRSSDKEPQRDGWIGILALQGGFNAHAIIIERLGLNPVLVRRPADLSRVSGLILPGGESSVMLRLLERADLVAPLCTQIQRGLPTLVTCAGLILCARRVRYGPRHERTQRSLGLLDIEVTRNGWGRQDQSFSASISRVGSSVVAATSDRSDHRSSGEALFIRAPRITRVGAGVEVLGSVRDEPVWVRSGALHGLTGHPELIDNAQIHDAVFGGLRVEASRHHTALG